MTKKIAILNQAPVGINYGSTIQTYALQTVLKKQGYFPEIIDRIRVSNHSKFKRFISNTKNELKNIFSRKLYITPRIFDKIFNEQFKFVKSNINISKRIDTNEQLKKYFVNNE